MTTKPIALTEKQKLAFDFLIKYKGFFATYLKKAHEEFHDERAAFGLSLTQFFGVSGEHNYSSYLNQSEIHQINGQNSTEILWRNAFDELGRNGDTGEGFADFYDVLLGENTSKNISAQTLLQRSDCLVNAVLGCMSEKRGRMLRKWRTQYARKFKAAIQMIEANILKLKQYECVASVSKLTAIVVDLTQALSFLKLNSSQLSKDQSMCYERCKKLVKQAENIEKACRFFQENKTINKKIFEIRIKAKKLKARRLDKDSNGKAAGELEKLADDLDSKREAHYEKQSLAEMTKGRDAFFKDCNDIIVTASQTSEFSKLRFGFKKFLSETKNFFKRLWYGAENLAKQDKPENSFGHSRSGELAKSASCLFESPNSLFKRLPAARNRGGSLSSGFHR